MTTHSTGVNWGQALATWIPIVLGMLAAIAGAIRKVRKWQDHRQAVFAAMISGAIGAFGKTIADEMKSVHQHLNQQDKETKARFDRVDRNTGTDST